MKLESVLQDKAETELYPIFTFAGANSSHTLVLIDGVEVNLTNDPSGVYDFSALPIDNIERIEVLRGPQSDSLRIRRTCRCNKHHLKKRKWYTKIFFTDRRRILQLL